MNSDADTQNVSASLSVVGLSRRERQLINLLIIKLIVDVLFVSWLTVSFHYQVFNPYFRGSLDRADAEQIAGWVADGAAPLRRVEVQLYIDNRFVASTLADLPRPDVLAAGRAEDERHGFAFNTPPLSSGEHEARVYAVHESQHDAFSRTLQLIGQPIQFNIEPRSN